MKRQFKKTISLSAAICAVLLTATGCKVVNNIDTSDNSSSAADKSTTEMRPIIDETTVDVEKSEQVTSLTDEVSEISSTTEYAETLPTESKQDETNAAESSKAEESSVVNSDAPTVQEATNIMGALDLIDRFGACAIPYDETKSYSNESGSEYYQIPKTQFTSTSDVREYMNDFMTTEFIAERYSSILDVAEPMCIDVNDELYIKNEPKSGGFSFSDTDPTIEKNFEDGYSILAAYDNFGAEETMDIRVINDDGIWKICGVTFGL